MRKFEKCRGMNKAKKRMFTAVHNDLETRFIEWYNIGDFYLMTATAVSEDKIPQTYYILYA